MPAQQPAKENFSLPAQKQNKTTLRPMRCNFCNEQILQFVTFFWFGIMNFKFWEPAVPYNDCPLALKV